MSGGSDVKETKPVIDVEDCVICFEALTNSDRTLVKLQCRHQFHLDCIGSAFNEKNKMICPCCRQIEKGEWLYANPGDPAIPPVGNINWNSANAVDLPVINWNWDNIAAEVGVDNQEMQPIEQSESGLFATAVVDPSYPPVINSDINMDNVDAEVGVDNQEMRESGLAPSVEGDIENDDVNIEYVEAEVRVGDQSVQEMPPVEQSESGLPPDIELFETDRYLRDFQIQFILRTRGTNNRGEIGIGGDNNGTARESDVEGDGGGRTLGEESG